MGFVFAFVFVLLARPTLVSMMYSLLLVVPGLLLRAYASGYVKKNAELTTTGPYAYTRNPLYLGSMLMAFGFAAASRSLLITLLLVLLFAVIYLPVIRAEETFLRKTFAGFDAYAASVPRILPRLRPAHPGQNGSGAFSFSLYRKHREYNALMGAAALYAVLALRVLYFH
jgi:protein-S-isoprenylcysteine O-methyltransferase Ste14